MDVLDHNIKNKVMKTKMNKKELHESKAEKGE